MEKVVLEPSTNTHMIEAKGVVSKDLGNGILQLDIEGEGVVTHGEHGTLKTESKRVIKYHQQEYNPVLKKVRNAVD